ncbi:MAG TPA: hypothetical protein DC047_04765 [Blastocatellia bacterium]|nr:hypothetical protein [Blastocatellia bacterium]
MKSRPLIFCLASLFVCASLTSVALRPPIALADGPDETNAADLPTLELTFPISGFAKPVGITHAGDGSDRLFVLEQGGRIRIVKNGGLLAAPFLDISSRIISGGERGLLGLAFAPGYSDNGRCYVSYSDLAGDTVIARYQRNATNADLADAGSEEIILTIAQPFTTHKGGQLAFGPLDNFLYISTGDGGNEGDPGNRAQDPGQLLGKILRINVELGQPATYTIPTDNPFFDTAGFAPEIWALGFRNPWRFSFDRQTADLYIADVGQASWEEIDFQPAGDSGGENYGWRLMEGTHCFNPANCSPTGLTPPVLEYPHSLGCSVIGGYVYRGTQFPRMQGIYFYADFCSGRIWALSGKSGAWQNEQLLDTNLLISTFGEDEVGNLYVGDYASGTIYTVIDSHATPSPTPTPIPTPSPTATATPPAQVIIEFSADEFEQTEADSTALVLVTRSGPSLENRTDTVDYSVADGTAHQITDFTLRSGSLTFGPGETQQSFAIPITEDTFAEGTEAATLILSDPSGNSVLGTHNTAALLITDDDEVDGSQNPNDDPFQFVSQHYHDFLSRQGDTDGLNFWTSQIEVCAGELACVADRRQNVSGSFFLSIEFQETGYLVYRFVKSASGEPPRYLEFFRDTQEVSRGVQVGLAGWQQQLEANKLAFADEFVTRPNFLSRYPSAMQPALYIDTLNANAGMPLSPAERDGLVMGLSSGSETRATALRKIAEDDDLIHAESNRAFVLMEYFGYLRRNPDNAPDHDLSGYDFWLKKLDDFGGDFVRAEMVQAFLRSAEYRQRFGPP